VWTSCMNNRLIQSQRFKEKDNATLSSTSHRTTKLASREEWCVEMMKKMCRNECGNTLSSYPINFCNTLEGLMAINSGNMCCHDPCMIETDQIFHPGQLSSSTSVCRLFISFHNHSVGCFFFQLSAGLKVIIFWVNNLWLWIRVGYQIID
jgi:hypothetical protein